jgi:hypothetical protein
MIYKISPNPSLPKRGKEGEDFAKEGERRGRLCQRGGKKGKTLPKRGREKPEMTHSITRRVKIINKNNEGGTSYGKTHYK